MPKTSPNDPGIKKKIEKHINMFVKLSDKNQNFVENAYFDPT